MAISWALLMLTSHSLRFRVAVYFALLGACLSLLFSGGVYFAAIKIGDRLIVETLHAELEDLVVRHQRNPTFIPPNTRSIKGYLLAEPKDARTIPDEIKSLALGTHNVQLAQGIYRILVAERANVRYFILFETDSQRQQEAELFSFLVVFALSMTLAAAGVGFWLALSIITPISRLAALVSHAKPDNINLSLSKLTRDDEVGELARAFDRYLRRLQDFIDREGYFTADVSHELRTPLAVILGTVEVLEQDVSLSDKQLERIERIRRAVQDMIELTHALLIMSREHAATTLDRTYPAGVVVSECVNKHLALIDHRPIVLSVELDAQLELYVERPLLEVVISNLIRNAVFNTESGSILVRLESDRLIVKDTGQGMHPDELAHALDRHYKGLSSSGSGLGLSLVKRICERYGWSILLESQAGRGTTVQIIFFQKIV